MDWSFAVLSSPFVLWLDIFAFIGAMFVVFLFSAFFPLFYAYFDTDVVSELSVLQLWCFPRVMRCDVTVLGCSVSSWRAAASWGAAVPPPSALRLPSRRSQRRRPRLRARVRLRSLSDIWHTQVQSRDEEPCSSLTVSVFRTWEYPWRNLKKSGKSVYIIICCILPPNLLPQVSVIASQTQMQTPHLLCSECWFTELYLSFEL